MKDYRHIMKTRMTVNKGINVSDKMWEKQRKLLKSYQRDKGDYL